MKDEEFDISFLLKTKGFDALNAEEQIFVVSEFGSREKYEAMREVLMDQSTSPNVLPPVEIRKNVMDAFDHFHSKEKRRIGLWIPQRKWYRQPITIALAAASILVAIFLILPYTGENLNRAKIAETKPSKKESPKTTSDKSDSVKAVESLDQKKDKSPTPESENKKEEIRSAQQSIVQSNALKDNTEEASIRTKAMPITSVPASKNLQSMADEAAPPAEIVSENEINSSPIDSNKGVVLKYYNLSREKSLDKKSQISEENTALEMDAVQESEAVMRSENAKDQDEMEADIFLITQPLPDHYIAY